MRTASQLVAEKKTLTQQRDDEKNRAAEAEANYLQQKLDFGIAVLEKHLRDAEIQCESIATYVKR